MSQNNQIGKDNPMDGQSMGQYILLYLLYIVLIDYMFQF